MNELKIAYEIGFQQALKEAGWLSDLFGGGGSAEFKAWKKAKPLAQREAENAANRARIEKARSVVRATAGRASGGGGRAVMYP